MPKKNELDEIVRAANDIFDHTTPETWNRLVTQMFERKTLEDLEELWQTKIDPQVMSFFMQYLEWKTLLEFAALADGSAYQRHFFRNLLNISPGLDVFQLEGYHIECATTMLREILAGFQRMELDEAAKLNDAGFERHHPGGYLEAITFHDKAIGLSPNFSLAWVNKGIALKNLGKLDEAIDCYDHVIEKIDPEYKKAWHNKGVALKNQGAIEEALQCFDKALGIDPEYEIARRVSDECRHQLNQGKTYGLNPVVSPGILPLLEMANGLISRGNWPAAARILQTALDKEPDNPSLLTILGEALVESGNMQEGEEHLQRAIDMDGKMGFAWLNIMRCSLARNDFQKALEQAERACDLMPEHAMAFANRSSALLGLERYQEAAESAQKSLMLDDHNSIALYNLGVSLWRLGDNQGASRILGNFVEWCANSPAIDSAKSILRVL